MRRCVLAPELVVWGFCLTFMFVDFENDSSVTVFFSSRLRLLSVCPRILYAVVYLTMLPVNQLHAIKPIKKSW
jgi:hypothetical protein